MNSKVFLYTNILFTIIILNTFAQAGDPPAAEEKKPFSIADVLNGSFDINSMLPGDHITKEQLEAMTLDPTLVPTNYLRFRSNLIVQTDSREFGHVEHFPDSDRMEISGAIGKELAWDDLKAKLGLNLRTKLLPIFGRNETRRAASGSSAREAIDGVIGDRGLDAFRSDDLPTIIVLQGIAQGKFPPLPPEQLLQNPQVKAEVDKIADQIAEGLEKGKEETTVDGILKNIDKALADIYIDRVSLTLKLENKTLSGIGYGFGLEAGKFAPQVAGPQIALSDDHFMKSFSKRAPSTNVFEQLSSLGIEGNAFAAFPISNGYEIIAQGYLSFFGDHPRTYTTEAFIQQYLLTGGDVENYYNHVELNSVGGRISLDLVNSDPSKLQLLGWLGLASLDGDDQIDFGAAAAFKGFQLSFDIGQRDDVERMVRGLPYKGKEKAFAADLDIPLPKNKPLPEGTFVNLHHDELSEPGHDKEIVNRVGVHVPVKLLGLDNTVIGGDVEFRDGGGPVEKSKYIEDEGTVTAVRVFAEAGAARSFDKNKAAALDEANAKYSRPKFVRPELEGRSRAAGVTLAGVTGSCSDSAREGIILNTITDRATFTPHTSEDSLRFRLKWLPFYMLLNGELADLFIDADLTAFFESSARGKEYYNYIEYISKNTAEYGFCKLSNIMCNDDKNNKVTYTAVIDCGFYI